MNIAFIVVIVAVAVIVVVARAFVVFDALLFRFDAACWLVLSSSVSVYVCVFVYKCTGYNCHCRYPRVLPTVPHAVVFIIIMMVVVVVMVGYGDGGVVVVLQIIHQLPSTVCALSK